MTAQGKFRKYCLLTNDVETTSISRNMLSDDAGLLVVNQGMPLLLDLYNKYNIRATFFFTGYMAKKHPEVVKMILPYGHEIACHGLTHKAEESFDLLSFDKQVSHLTEARKILEDISGTEVISFRAPALRVNQYTPEALLTAGFKIDSSIASQRMDMFFSFGSWKKLSWITAPRYPYKTDVNNLARKGNSGIIEVPVSAFIVPYIGTSIRVMPSFIRMIRYLLYYENRFNRKPINLLVHPNEFISETLEGSIIERRAGNYFQYLLVDFLRGKLKLRNLGPESIRLLEREIQFFRKKGFEFETIGNYVKQTGIY